jgi:hypothetical protein
VVVKNRNGGGGDTNPKLLLATQQAQPILMTLHHLSIL